MRGVGPLSVRGSAQPTALTRSNLPSRNASTNSAWSCAPGRRSDPEVDEVVDEPVASPPIAAGDRLLGLEVDEVLVAVLVGDAVDLGGRPAEVARAPAPSRPAR